MFNFIKKLFADKEPEQAEVALEQLESWINEKTAQLNFNNFFQEYFEKIIEIKKNLQDKLADLKVAEVPKEHKNVEHRIRNIVKGHKDQYAREIEIFLENLDLLKKEKFSALEDYQEVIRYNKKLDKSIESVAKRTSKSYQAAQHLYFKPVEEVFKLMGELNLLVKNFNKNDYDKKVEKIEELKNLTIQLEDEIKKKKDFQEQIKSKEELLKNKNEEANNKQKQLEQLKESKEYKNHLKLKNKKEELEKKIKELNDQIYAYFSKLTKAFKRYERVALDDKLIKKYLENNVQTFWEDTELKVSEILEGLKKSLSGDSLQFDEKQKNKFLEIISRGSEDFFQKFKDEYNKLNGLVEAIVNEIKCNKIIDEIENVNSENKNVNEKISRIETEIKEIKSKLEKIDLSKLKSEIKIKVEEVFDIEIKLN